MAFRIPSPRGTPDSKAAVPQERLGESSRRGEETSGDLSEGGPSHERHEQGAPSSPTAGLQRPEAGLRPSKPSPSRAALSQLPNELKLLVTTELSWEDALHLRQASSDYLRLSDDPQMIRDQYKKAGLALPKEGLETPEARDAAWEHFGRVMQLRRQYAVGPTSVRVLKEFDVGYTPTFSPDGRFVLANTRLDNTVQLWDLQQNSPRAVLLEGHTKHVSSATFSPDSRFVLTASSDHTARLWNLEQTPPRSVALEGHGAQTSATFSPDGRFVLTASYDDTARLWDLKQNPPQAVVLRGHTVGSKVAKFSFDGRFALISPEDLDGQSFGPTEQLTARIWDLGQDPPRAIVLEGHTRGVTSATFSPDGRFALTASHDHTARLWNLEQAPPRAIVLEGHTKAVTAATFSPDGRFVLTESKDGTARLWNLEQDPLRAIIFSDLPGPVLRNFPTTFSPDGRFVLTTPLDGNAYLWDIKKNFPSAVLEGRQAHFSPDGRFVLTVSSGRTPQLWNLEQDPPQAVVLKGHTPWLEVVTFAPNGRFVLTTSVSHVGHLIDFAPKAQTSRLDQIAASGANLWRFLLRR